MMAIDTVGEVVGEAAVGESVGGVVGADVVGEPDGDVVRGDDVGALVRACALGWCPYRMAIGACDPDVLTPMFCVQIGASGTGSASPTASATASRSLSRWRPPRPRCSCSRHWSRWPGLPQMLTSASRSPRQRYVCASPAVGLFPFLLPPFSALPPPARHRHRPLCAARRHAVVHDGGPRPRLCRTLVDLCSLSDAVPGHLFTFRCLTSRRRSPAPKGRAPRWFATRSR